jgi:hypothetical protein
MFIDFIYFELNKHIGGLPLLRIAQYRYGNFYGYQNNILIH